MRPLYPRSDFAADPGLVPDTENHKTPHPDAPTAPRTADTGASDPAGGSFAGLTGPPAPSSGLAALSRASGAPNAVDSYIASLLAPAKGLAGATGAIPVQFQNPVGINPFLHTAPPLSGGQVFLRNLVGGYNAKAGFDPSNPKSASALAALLRAQREAAGPAADPLLPLKQAHLQALVDATNALKDKRELDDPNADLRRQLLLAQIQATKALAGERGRAPAGGGNRGPLYGYSTLKDAINTRASALLKQRQAAVYTIAQQNKWTPGQTQAALDRMTADVSSQHSDALRALDEKYGNPTPIPGASGAAGPSTLDILNGP